MLAIGFFVSLAALLRVKSFALKVKSLALSLKSLALMPASLAPLCKQLLKSLPGIAHTIQWIQNTLLLMQHKDVIHKDKNCNRIIAKTKKTLMRQSTWNNTLILQVDNIDNNCNKHSMDNCHTGLIYRTNIQVLETCEYLLRVWSPQWNLFFRWIDTWNSHCRPPNYHVCCPNLSQHKISWHTNQQRNGK